MTDIPATEPAAVDCIAITEPATGDTLFDLTLPGPEGMDKAVRTARARQAEWAATSFDVRANIMRRAAQLIRERADTLTEWLVREGGSTQLKAGWEINATYEQIAFAAALPGQPMGELFASSMPGRQNMCRRVPVGVVGVIAPWNFPLLLSIRSVAPALALGNTVVLKPDIQTSMSGGLLIAEIFAEAGLPEGVLHIVPGDGAIGRALVEHPLVDMISFTGSTAVGRQIGEHCGRALKKHALELGGNNAMVILDDADVEAAASCGAWGAFLHQGQICMQAGRHLVHAAVADHYADALAKRARALRVGDPFRADVELGPMINQRQVDRLQAVIDATVMQGAQIVTGGVHDGLFFSPTVMTHVPPDSPAFGEEL